MTICALSSVFISAQTLNPVERKEQQNRDKRDENFRRRGDGWRELNDYRPAHVMTAAEAERLEAARESARILARRLEVDPADETQYKAFLKSRKGGIFRLLPDRDCTTNFLVRVDTGCSEFMDGGSAYSFRSKQYFGNASGYLSRPYSDIQFNNGLLESKGFLEQGMMISLGDVPLETVTGPHSAITSLLGIKRASSPAEADRFRGDLDKGIEANGYALAARIDPKLNQTYAMRMIAYKTDGIDLHEQPTAIGYKFYGLNFDKRADLTIVFRIVRVDPDGRLTIAWHELERKKAPTLKF